MRQREKTRRETRKGKYSEDPALHEEDKAIARRKYYARVGRINKTIIEDALQRNDLPDGTRTLLTQLVEDSSAISTAALRKMISGGSNKAMPRGKKNVATGDGSAAPVVVDDRKVESKVESVVVGVVGNTPVVKDVVVGGDNKTVAKGSGAVSSAEGKKTVSKGKKEKTIITTKPGEQLSIRMEKGVRVTFS